MKRSRFTDEQIVRILQEADKDSVAEVAKRHGVSEPSIYAWRKKFGDLGTDDGNPPVRSGLSEVEFSPMEEVLHEEVPF
jgi:transposase-like protein